MVWVDGGGGEGGTGSTTASGRWWAYNWKNTVSPRRISIIGIRKCIR